MFHKFEKIEFSCYFSNNDLHFLEFLDSNTRTKIRRLFIYEKTYINNA